MAISSRVSDFEASLMKIKKKIFCEGANVTFAAGRTIIVGESSHLWFLSEIYLLTYINF